MSRTNNHHRDDDNRRINKCDDEEYVDAREIARRRELEQQQEWNDDRSDVLLLGQVFSKDTVPTDAKCYVSGRESSPGQNDHMPIQIDGVVRAVEAADRQIVGISEGHVGTGKNLDWLREEVRKAKECGADTLVFESPTRVARSENQNSKSKTDWKSKPNASLVNKVHAITEGLRLCFIVHPDATPEEARHYESNIRNPNKPRGGRPKKSKKLPRSRANDRQRKQAWQPLVRKLSASGKSFREIAKELNNLASEYLPVCAKTVWNWANEAVDAV